MAKPLTKRNSLVPKQYSRFHWFPVEEYSPKDGTDVIVTILMKTKTGFEYYLREFASYYCSSIPGTPGYWDIPDKIKHSPDFQKVTAWMYAPGVYRAPLKSN